MRSPWALGAARCAFEGAGWAPWLQGFAALLWLRPAGAGRRDDAGGERPRPKASPAAAAPPATPLPAADAPDEWQPESPEGEPARAPLDREPPRAAELSHVLSLGHDSLVFELWLDACSGNLPPTPPIASPDLARVPGAGPRDGHVWSAGRLTFRLSRPDASSGNVVSEARADAALPPQRWTCLALNVKEHVHKRRIHIQVYATDRCTE